MRSRLVSVHGGERAPTRSETPPTASPADGGLALAPAPAAVPHNLPAGLSSFVGRERELAEVGELLASERLLTLTGAGGCGKTRLALEAALEGLERHPDGAWWIELAPLSDPELVGAEIAALLGVRPLPGKTPLEAACAYLSSRRALVVLDNCEHLLEACAETASALAASGPGVTVLATSRAPLGVGGEADWRVPSLSLPESSVDGSLAALGRSDAVRLFAERAKAARPGFELDPANAGAVASICTELDGLPLALELAAARLRVLSADDIAARLSDRFRLIARGPATAPSRQRTLRASVDWSHDLLSRSERALLRRIAVFSGSFSLAAIEAVCADEEPETEREGLADPGEIEAEGRVEREDAVGPEGEIGPADTLDLLASLVDHSLVIAEEDSGSMRYRLLETVRQYGAEKLAEAGEAEALRDRHRDFFLALAEREAPKLETAAQREGLEVLDPEAANLGAALDRALETEPVLTLRLCWALNRWWCAHGRYREAQRAHARSLDAAGGKETALRARVHFARAYAAARAGEWEDVESHATEAIALAAEVGDLSTEARARSQLGVSMQSLHPQAARAHYKRGTELARSARDDWAVVHGEQGIARTYLIQSDSAPFTRTNEGAAALAERIGDPFHVAGRWFYLAYVAVADGRFADAREAVERLRDLLEADTEPVLRVFGELCIGLIQIWEGKPQHGFEHLEAQLERALNLGAGIVAPLLINSLAFGELAGGRLEEARNRLEDLLPLIEGRDNASSAWGLGVLAEAHRLLGEDNSAEEAALRGQQIGEEIGNRLYATRTRLTLGRLAASRGEWSAAREHALAHLDACVEGGHATFVPGCLDALAEVAAGLGADADAVRLLAAAERAREEIGIVRVPPESEHWEAIEGRLRDSLGDEGYEAARAQGAELTTADALEWARRGRGPRQRAADGWESLTPTELRVAELVAEGLTNPEIAERMFVSKATVKTHVAHIFDKLDVHSRAELSAEAARQHRTG